MSVSGKIRVMSIAGFGPIVRETATSRKLYREASLVDRIVRRLWHKWLNRRTRGNCRRSARLGQ